MLFTLCQFAFYGRGYVIIVPLLCLFFAFFFSFNLRCSHKVHQSFEHDQLIITSPVVNKLSETIDLVYLCFPKDHQNLLCDSLLLNLHNVAVMFIVDPVDHMFLVDRVIRIVQGFTSLALFSPFWHEHLPDPLSTNNSESFTAFGLLRFCFQEQFVTLQEIDAWRSSKYCSFYENIFSGIPSIYWKGAASTYALALVLLLGALFLAHVACCQRFICGKSVFAIVLCFAVALLVVSLLVYPFGFKSTYVQQHCGSSSGFFTSGACDIAWGYVLAIVSTALLFFCPMIAYHLSVARPRSKATVV